MNSAHYEKSPGCSPPCDYFGSLTSGRSYIVRRTIQFLPCFVSIKMATLELLQLLLFPRSSTVGFISLCNASTRRRDCSWSKEGFRDNVAGLNEDFQAYLSIKFHYVVLLLDLMAVVGSPCRHLI
ncbi:hypothetical protein M514_11950 [Trichuris suis]|uniref:Uncharacterized protein n=1 Tax=Trichuris suis TaxID=68888 RepID=A0A085NTK9_9BILA|nr:hypothetical protein M513_11950 [Trichuris suis]KFD72805.1 hypothetical protein M514_11950 [Trichuris suis]KHJ46274.1 hypothetical protein D918_03322 [Trichuris suis]